MNHRVIWCPPVGESTGFDPHQFANRKIKSSRISFNDMSRLHVLHVGDKKPGRRLPTPAWAMNDSALREVIVVYLEDRLFVRDRSGTLHERLARCRAAAVAQLPRKREQLRRLIERYRDLSRLPETPTSTLRRLEGQIANIDSDILLASRLPEIVASVVYGYFRLCWNSVSVAECLSIKPCAVRQMIFRMGRAAKRIFESSKKEK